MAKCDIAVTGKQPTAACDSHEHFSFGCVCTVTRIIEQPLRANNTLSELLHQIKDRAIVTSHNVTGMLVDCMQAGAPLGLEEYKKARSQAGRVRKRGRRCLTTLTVV